MKKQSLYGVATTVVLMTIVVILIVAGAHQEAAAATATAAQAAETTTVSTGYVTTGIYTVADGYANGESTFTGTNWREIFSPQAMTMLAKTLYGEADGVASDAERSMVIWCILNRYDSGEEWFGTTIPEIISKPGQFAGYNPDHPVTERNLVLVKDVIFRYQQEKNGGYLCARTLPEDVYFFYGNGHHNIFYKMSQGTLSGERVYFGYTPLCNPYDD